MDAFRGEKRLSLLHCGCASNLKLQFQSYAVFQPGRANAGDTGSHRSEGDKHNLDVVMKSSQGSEHMVHTNPCHVLLVIYLWFSNLTAAEATFHEN